MSVVQAAVADVPGAAAVPSRARIAEFYLADETELVRDLAEEARLTNAERERVDAIARRLVHAARATRRQFGSVDAFMAEYSLSSQEGVVLMCLAEALLRVPDAETADRLIADKISEGDWEKHLGHSDSLFVNASSWGLMLTGRFLGFAESEEENAYARLKSLAARSGEPVIRQAVRHAMRIMGEQFVLGRTIAEALKRGRADAAKGYLFSFDMLGEAAVTAADADRYFASYSKALKAVAEDAGQNDDPQAVFQRPSLSVKLSALHPRYEEAQEDRVFAELYPRLIALARNAKAANIGLTVDAEESERLDISLEIFARACLEPELRDWNGLGLAIQAYGRRAYPVIEWLRDLAGATGRRLPVRLVKGAYWDTEVKNAQIEGVQSYPVFTRKVSTDVSFLACARLLLNERDAFYPQFATHNAHTAAAIQVMSGNQGGFEFQRLHGMGEGLYADIAGTGEGGYPCRIYAPVGSHEDLLAYLVRRLLENGANSSFVNRIADDEAPVADIIADPVLKLDRLVTVPHPKIPAPARIFPDGRESSRGLVLTERSVREPLYDAMRDHLSRPLAAMPLTASGKGPASLHPVFAPHDHRVEIGTVAEADAATVETAVATADAAAQGWDAQGGAARGALLRRVADLYEDNLARLMAIIVREAGKTLANALGDVREAVDFLRYYAGEAEKDFEGPLMLPGPTGEENRISLHGRGVFACISPWNFPLAIFTGQVSAALAAGNTVLAKPAEQTPIIAFEAVRLFHEAGVPVEVLQLLPGAGETIGAALVGDERVMGVAFTGSNATASLIHRALAQRAGAIVPLIAETGGINAMIVDSTALPEQAVRDAVRSAFDSAGQRCSALRVLFVQDDIADKLIPMLAGAAEELRIGDPFDFSTDVGPVIDADARDTLNAHKQHMAREAKTLCDLPLPDECRYGTFVSPAIYEIDALSALERETFGPIMHIVRYKSHRLDEVCDAVNATGYGLTLGIHTRIQRTADFVAERVRAGNVYVNRNQIGAVVGVQPFGGEGLSGTGPKAGGPHYLARFAVERVRSTDTTSSGGNASLMTLDD